MHVVYLISFINRVTNMEYPCFYIGSKSNCDVIEGKIIDMSGKEYLGSSTSFMYKELIKTEDKNVLILFQTNDYTECLLKERDYQIMHDVVADVRFFNKSIATINNYSNPDYATYKHSLYEEVRRLPRNHPLVLEGIWVGVTKGRKIPESEKHLRRRFGKENSFFGKTHSRATIESNKKKFKSWVENNPEYIQTVSKNAKERFKGRAKSAEQKEKMSASAKGYVTLKNKITLECIRIKKNSEEYKKLNLDEWATPYLLRESRDVQCDVCVARWLNTLLYL